MATFDEIAQQMAAEQSSPPSESGPVAGAGTVLAPEPPPPPSFDDVAAQMKAEEEQRARLMRYRAATDATPPERRAQVIKYAVASRLPPDVVAADFERVKREVDASTVDWAQLRQEQPGLVKYLDERPEGHPLVQEDLDRLHGVEWALKAGKLKVLDSSAATVDALLNALKYVNHDVLGIPRLAGPEGPSPGEQLLQTSQEAGGAPRAVNAMESTLYAPVTPERMAAERGTYGAESLPGRMYVGSAGALPFLAGNTLAATAAGPAGIVAFNAGAVRGDMEQRFSNIRDARTGEKLDPDTVETASNLAALTNGALQLVPVGKLVGVFGKGAAAIPLAKQLTQRFAADAVEKVLVQPGATALLKRAATEWGTHTLTAGVAMGLQGAVNQGAEEALKGTAGQDVQLVNVADAFARDFLAGMRDMALLSATGPGLELVQGTRRLAESRAAAGRYAQLVAATSESKMRARSPEEFERAVGKMAEQPEAAKTISIPIEAWNTYFQSVKADPEGVAKGVLEDGGMDYIRASATKGELVIPVDRFLSRLHNVDLAGLSDDVRLSRDALTPREARAAAEAQRVRLEEQAKARGAELDLGKQEVHDFIAEQARAAGIPKADAEANAKLVAEYAGTMALRMGVTVQEAARLGGLDRLSILGPKGEAVAAAARERFAQFLTPSASRKLQERLATMSPEARAREYFVDPVTGLRNRRAFDATPAPEGKRVAVITPVDIKAINDSPEGGHDRANELLRTIGAAIGDPEAARSGTNFLLHVKDQAELDQVLAKVRATLPDQRLSVEGALGATAQEAGKALDARVDQRRAAGELPPRGQAPGGVEVAKLAFPEGRAATTVPPELVAKLSALSHEEYFRQAYQDEKSPGILSREGWDALPRKAYVASVDLRGLKDLNARLGKAAGDEVLRQFGEIASHFGGSSFDFAHLSGDEYAAQADSPERLQAFLDRLQREAHNRIQIEWQGPDGEVQLVRSQGFRHGIARGSYGAADRELNRAKLEEQAAGAGAPELGGSAGGGQGPLDQNQRPGDLEGGRGPLGRGAQGQGYPGAEGLAQAAVEDTSFDVAHLEGAPVTLGSGLREARALIGRMRGERQVAAQAFLDYALGVTEKRPQIGADLERELAKYGVVDPAGFTFDEGGREMARAIGGRKKLNAEPASLREYRLRRTGQYSGYGDQYEQPAAGGGEGGARPPPRGRISFQVTPEGRPVEFRIEAFRGDRSTLAHETAHFLSWSLHELATSDLAAPDLRSDYDALLKWAGYKDAADRVASRDAAREEKFSHAWEQYLAEGRAPSRALERVFSRFKDWMLRIYRGLGGIGAQYKAQHGEELQLSDEVRRVFDRLLAADEGLTGAREESGQTGQPEADAMAGMTPDQQEAYRTAIADARATADAETLQRMAELEKGEVAQARTRISSEVAAELDQQPRYRLWRFLQRGELADGKGGALLGKAVPELLRDESGQPLQLSREAVREQFGQRVADTLGPLLARKGGVTPDELAPLFGYETGQDLVGELFNSKPRDQVIQEKTQERVDAQYGPALQHIQEAAAAAIHGDAAARATLLALRGLAKQVDPAQARRVHSLNLETLKDTAARMVGETPVGALNPERYQRAERATTKRAERLWGAGKKAEALDEREAALLNQVLYRAARDTQERLERARAKLEGTSEEQRAQLGKADPSYRDVHDALLAAVELGPGPVEPGKALGLDAMLKRAEADAQEMEFDVELIRGLLAEPAPWHRLTADEAQAVADASANIRTAARRRNEVTLAGKTQTKDAFFAELQGALRKRKPLPPAPADRAAEGLREKLGHLGRGADAILTDVPETFSHMLDAGERQGPAHRLLVDSRLEARAKAVELTKKVLKPIREAFEKVPKDVRKLRDQVAPELTELLPVREDLRGRQAPKYTRSTLWSLFLNWGNEQNRQRIRDGNGWTDDQVQRALNLLTKPEVDFLHQVARTIDGLFPEIAAAYEKRTGLPLKKVEGSEFAVNGEQLPGHYFPLRYRSDLSPQGERQAGDDIASLFQPNYVRPTTRAGHTKARVERVAAPVDLSWGVVPAHLEQVVQDLAYGDWVRDAGGLLQDERFKGAAAQYLGPERAKELVPWLRDVANARADSAAGPMSDLQRTVGGFARNRLAVAVLGANIPNMLQNLTDPWGAMLEDVGALRIGTAYLKVMNPANWGRMKEFGLSKELAFRDSALSDNMRRELARMGPGGTGVAQAVAEVSFRLYEWLDHFGTRVTWKAAFDHELGKGATEEAAAARADDVVRRTFASHDIAERPPILRTKYGIGAVLTFYSWANRRWNQLRRAGDDVARGTRSPADFAAKLIGMAVVGVAGSFLAGRGPKKDEDVAEWAAIRALLEPLNTIPWVGGIAEALVKGQEVDVRSAPELAFVVDTVNRLQKMVKTAEGDKAAADKLWLTVEGMLGLAGAPAGQIQRTGDYLRKLVAGETQPRGPLDVASGLIYGEKKNPVSTPLTAAQDLISGQ